MFQTKVVGKIKTLILRSAT